MKVYCIGILIICVLVVLVVHAHSVTQVSLEELAKRNGCIGCHGPENKAFGPSFSDIAEKYKNDTAAKVSLFNTIKHGSKGKWVQVAHGVPMPPYSGRLSDKEINSLVEWTLRR